MPEKHQCSQTFLKSKREDIFINPNTYNDSNGDYMKKTNNFDNASIAGLLLASMAIAAALVFSPFAGFVLSATSPSSNVIGTVNVPGTCFASISPNAINFGSLGPTAQYPPTNVITDSNSHGNVAANIMVSGNDWTSASSNTFGVTNTVWNPTVTAVFSQSNALTSTPVDTGIQIGARSTNTVVFGLQIPSGQAADTYTQTITIESAC